MPIIDLQRRIAEAGRIRIGSQVETQNGRTRPVKLETFRLTSPDKLRIEQAAGLWGGKPQQWDAPAGKQWEVFTDASALDVIVPPADMAFSQSYELWSAGGCKRRCDGRWNSVAEGDCVCDPDDRECDIHTRLSVMLRDLPGLGVWRVDTQGYYAAVELQGAVQVIEMAAGRGQLLPARLLLVQRQVKRLVNDKPQTRKFAVPVLDIEVTPGQLLAVAENPRALESGIQTGQSGVDGSAPLMSAAEYEETKQRFLDAQRHGRVEIIQHPPSTLTPVPASVQHRPSGSVAQQMQASTVPQERKRRANSAQPVPATGIQPRTAAQAAADLSETPAAQKPSANPQDGNRSSAPPDNPDLAAALKASLGPIRRHLPGPTSDPEPKEEDGPGKATAQQIRVLFSALVQHGFNAQKEPDTLLQIVETLAGRELTGPHKAVSGNPQTTKNLTRAEADQVIARLRSCDSQAGVWELVQTLTDAPDAPAELPFQDDPAPF